ncbi:hypothetical protein GCM10009000_009140 [Halobacterium noricense]|uniref:Uncharacterized protein n=1 Tax=Haladaptatus pallidirubidus TaxID=1008152 RepID=A0AAV3UQ79_9EURY
MSRSEIENPVIFTTVVILISVLFSVFIQVVLLPGTLMIAVLTGAFIGLSYTVVYLYHQRRQSDLAT